MQRNILLLSILATASLQAENALQIIPAQLTSGAGTLSVQLVSESSMSACQLDLSLPSGLTLGELTVGSNANNGHTVLSQNLGTSASYDGYTTHRLLLYSTSNGSFAANSGVVINVPVSGNLDDGTYPVYVDNAVLDNAAAGTNHSAIALSMQSSYLTVGNPAATEVVLDGQVPSYVVEQLNSDASVTSIDLTTGPVLASTLSPANPNAIVLTTDEGLTLTRGNIVLSTTRTCSNFSLTDGYAFQTPLAFTASAANYIRTIKSTSNWGTLCLPYALASNEAVQFYQLSAADLSEGTLTFTAVESVVAGQPCLFKKLTADATSVDFSVSADAGTTISEGTQLDALADIDAWQMLGTYTQQSIQSGDGLHYFYISSDEFRHAVNAVKFNPFRAVFESTAVLPAEASSIRILVNTAGETAILGVNPDGELEQQPLEAIYDLTGRRVTVPTPGQIHIVNGKKVKL